MKISIGEHLLLAETLINSMHGFLKGAINKHNQVNKEEIRKSKEVLLRAIQHIDAAMEGSEQ